MTEYRTHLVAGDRGRVAVIQLGESLSISVDLYDRAGGGVHGNATVSLRTPEQCDALALAALNARSLLVGTLPSAGGARCPSQVPETAASAGVGSLRAAIQANGGRS